MFEKIADFIMKYSKYIVIFWIALLLISTPFIYKVIAEPGSVLSYDMTTMTGDDSESVQGLKIIYDSDYFYQSDIGTEMLLVIESDNNEETAIIEGSFYGALFSAFEEKYGEGIVSLFSLGFSTKDITVTDPSGIVMMSVAFTDGRNAGNEVTSVRDIVSDVKNSAEFAENDLKTYLTGSAAIGSDTETGAMEDVKKIDPFSILLVLVLIGLFFRSLISAATPPMTIGFAYGIVMMVICGIAQFMDIYYITSTIVLVSMLGAGCDYCIFIIARYREERKSGKDKDGALREAIIWAGESITISGLSVIIGFGVMSFCSFSVISTMGLVLAAGIVFALLAALTLIPSILMLAGDRIFYPSTIETYQEGSKTMNGLYGKISRFGQNYFKKSAHFSIKYAAPIVIIALLVTAPLAYITVTEGTSYDMISIMPAGEAKEGVDTIVDNANGGMIMPTYVLLDAGREIADIEDNSITMVTGQKLGTMVWAGDTPEAKAATASTYFYLTMSQSAMAGMPTPLPAYIDEKDVEDNIATMYGALSWDSLVAQAGSVDAALLMLGNMLPEQMASGISNIAKMDDATWSAVTQQNVYTQTNAIDYILNYSFGQISKYVDGHQYVKMTIMTQDQPMSDKSMNSISEIQSATEEFMGQFAESKLFVKSLTTGSAVAIYDISQIVNKEFLWIEIAVVVLIFILLFFVMRSYLTPARSILTIVMSIIWTLGITHLLFGHAMGMPITWIVPIVLFVICLGLGMDYDILLTTRIKEYVSKGMSNDDAILHAVEKSGAVITICGLIMGGAFLTMALSTSPMLMEFGFALGFAILVDALLVRTYIVPAVMHLMGKWNWVGPGFLKPHAAKTEEKD